MAVQPSGSSNSPLPIIKWMFMYLHLFNSSHFITRAQNSGKEKREFGFCFFLALLNPKCMEMGKDRTGLSYLFFIRPTHKA